MSFRGAQQSDIPRITGLIGSERHGPLSNPPENIASQIKRDIETSAGPFQWILAEAGGNLTVGRIAVIPPPPIYDLKGGLAGIVLGTWRDTGAVVDVDPFEKHLSDRGVAMLVIACAANNRSLREQLAARGYTATTNYMLKQDLTPQPAKKDVRPATEADIPALVAFNREGRERLHEANPTFWTSHPDAEARFALWMKFSLTMRDRAMFVNEGDNNLSGFIIAQPASPIQVPIEIDEAQVGVIDDFHCTTFGKTLLKHNEDASARNLLAAAGASFIERDRTSAIAICPAAWTAKFAVLQRYGYRTEHTWHVRKPCSNRRNAHDLERPHHPVVFGDRQILALLDRMPVEFVERLVVVRVAGVVVEVPSAPDVDEAPVLVRLARREPAHGALRLVLLPLLRIEVTLRVQRRDEFIAVPSAPLRKRRRACKFKPHLEQSHSRHPRCLSAPSKSAS
jgi:hypothetical protein